MESHATPKPRYISEFASVNPFDRLRAGGTPSYSPTPTIQRSISRDRSYGATIRIGPATRPASAIAAHNAKLQRSGQRATETAVRGSLVREEEKQPPSSSLYVGTLSQTATPKLLFELAQRLICADSIVLKVGTDGTRFAYFNFVTPNDANVALVHIEAIKAAALCVGDRKLFTWETEIRYSKGKPKPFRRDISGEKRVGPVESRSVSASFLNYSITQEDLDELQYTQLRGCGFSGVSISYHWSAKSGPANRGTRKLHFGACHAVFIFNSFKCAERGLTKLTEMKEKERGRTPLFFTNLSTLKWGPI